MHCGVVGAGLSVVIYYEVVSLKYSHHDLHVTLGDVLFDSDYGDRESHAAVILFFLL